MNALWEPAPTICSPQPSPSTACVSSSNINRGTLSNKGSELQSAAVNILTCQQTFDEDEQKDIDNLRTMFPDKDKSFLSVALNLENSSNLKKKNILRKGL